MDISRNELVSPEEMEQLRRVDPAKAKRFEEVPKNLIRASRVTLRGRRRAFVSFTSGGKLSQWAEEQRKKKMRREKKTRRRTATASRRRNR